MFFAVIRPPSAERTNPLFDLAQTPATDHFLGESFSVTEPATVTTVEVFGLSVSVPLLVGRPTKRSRTSRSFAIHCGQSVEPFVSSRIIFDVPARSLTKDFLEPPDRC